MEKVTAHVNKMLLQTAANKIVLRSNVIAVAEKKHFRGRELRYQRLSRAFTSGRSDLTDNKRPLAL